MGFFLLGSSGFVVVVGRPVSFFAKMWEVTKEFPSTGVVGMRLLPFGLAVFASILERRQTLRLGAALKSRHEFFPQTFVGSQPLRTK